MELIGGPPDSPYDAGGGLLLERARSLLVHGPLGATELAARVCQLTAAPPAVAEHLVLTLLGGRAEFQREPDGRWAVSLATAASSPHLSGAGAAAASERLDELSFAVVDVETTGGRAEGGDRVTEIAIVPIDRLQVGEPLQTLVNPQRSIPPWITALTNISWEMVCDAPPFAQVCATVRDALHGRVFVAHNATFDWRFVEMEVRRATGGGMSGRRLCTVRLARRLLPHLPRRSLDHVCHYFGVANGGRHRAAGDALATAHVLIALLREARSRGCESWSDLEALLAAAPRRRRGRRSALPRPSLGEEPA